MRYTTLPGNPGLPSGITQFECDGIRNLRRRATLAEALFGAGVNAVTDSILDGVEAELAEEEERDAERFDGME